MDFPIELDEHSALPKYRQLSVAIGQAIDSGRLKPGDPLPTTRHIAESLGLARGTVVRAYNELLGQGYLEGKTGTGTTVSKSLPASVCASEDSQPSFTSLTNTLSAFAHRLTSVPNVGSTSGDLPALNYGCAPRNLLPVKPWRDLVLSYCRSQEELKLCYVCEPFGHRPLREAIARYLMRTKAVQCKTSQVVVFSGPQQALAVIASLLLDRDDLVVVENPGYVGARELFLAYGAQLEAHVVDENGICLDGLDETKKSKLIYVTPSSHDPSGNIMSPERRADLLAYAKSSGSMILEDAWDSDYRYGGPAIPSLQGISDGQSVIYLYSFWKVLFPLTTACVVIIPDHLVPVFTRAKLLLERQSPMLEYFALTDFINNGMLDAHIMKTRKIYQGRRQALIHALSTEFRSQIALNERSAGLHLMVRILVDRTEAEILELAKQADLPMVSTRLYYVNEPVDKQFLIPFSSLPEEAISARVKLFASLLN
ncbi:PLP-dependent aminotransferase family protein [soil metagenome]